MAYKRQTRDVYFRGRQALDPSKQLKETSNQQAQNERLFVSDLERQGRQYEQALTRWDKNEERKQKELTDFWDEVSPAMAKLTSDTLKQGLLYQQKEDIAKTWREYRALDPETRINIREGLRLHQEGEAERNTEARDIINSVEELRDRKNETGEFLLNEEQRGSLDSYANFLRDRSVSSRSSIYLSLSREVASMLPLEINEALTNSSADGRIFEHNGVSFTNAERLNLTDSSQKELWAEVITETIIEENRLRSDFGGLSNDTINSALYDIVEQARLTELTKDKVRINEASKEQEYQSDRDGYTEAVSASWEVDPNNPDGWRFVPTPGLTSYVDGIVSSGKEESEILRELVTPLMQRLPGDLTDAEKIELIKDLLGFNGPSVNAKGFYYENGQTLSDRLNLNPADFDNRLVEAGVSLSTEFFGDIGTVQGGSFTPRTFVRPENSEYSGMTFLHTDLEGNDAVTQHGDATDNVNNGKIIDQYLEDGQLKDGWNNNVLGRVLERAFAGQPLSNAEMEALMAEGDYNADMRALLERANSMGSYRGTYNNFRTDGVNKLSVYSRETTLQGVVVVMEEDLNGLHNIHALRTLQQEGKLNGLILIREYPDGFENTEASLTIAVENILEPYKNNPVYDSSREAFIQNFTGQYFELYHGKDSDYAEIPEAQRGQLIEAELLKRMTEGTHNFDLDDTGRATHLLSGDSWWDNSFEKNPEEIQEDINSRRVSMLQQKINQSGGLAPGDLQNVMGTESFQSMVLEYNTNGHWPVHIVEIAAENGQFPHQFMSSQVGSDTITIGDTVVSLAEDPTQNVSSLFASPEAYFNFIKLSNDGSVISANRNIYEYANNQFTANGQSKLININTTLELAKELLPSSPEALGYNQVDSTGTLRLGRFQMPEEAIRDVLGTRYNNRGEFLRSPELQEEAYKIWISKVITEQHGLSDRTSTGVLDRQLGYSFTSPQGVHSSEAGYLSSVLDILLPPSAQRFSPQGGGAADTQRIESTADISRNPSRAFGMSTPNPYGDIYNRLVDTGDDRLGELTENSILIQRYFAIERGGS